MTLELGQNSSLNGINEPGNPNFTNEKNTQKNNNHKIITIILNILITIVVRNRIKIIITC